MKLNETDVFSPQSLAAQVRADVYNGRGDGVNLRLADMAECTVWLIAEAALERLGKSYEWGEIAWSVIQPEDYAGLDMFLLDKLTMEWSFDVARLFSSGQLEVEAVRLMDNDSNRSTESEEQ